MLVGPRSCAFPGLRVVSPIRPISSTSATVGWCCASDPLVRWSLRPMRVDREYRVLKALEGTGVPVPRAILFHNDDDVVGTPFYLMERLEGRVFHDCALPGVSPPDRGAMYRSVAQTLATLHSVDFAAVGLGDFGRPGDYFDRQIGRWSRQWETSPSRADFPDIDPLVAWLQAHKPDGDVRALHRPWRLPDRQHDVPSDGTEGDRDPRLGACRRSAIRSPISASPASRGTRGLTSMAASSARTSRLLGIPTQAEYVATYSERDAGPAAAHRFSRRVCACSVSP